jgi:hypothetical protein
MRRTFSLLMVLGGSLAFCQGPPKYFELEIPDFQNKIFDSDVIEIPIRNPGRIVIHLLAPMADSVSYGKIFPKLNGEAASVISQYRSTSRGKAIWMDLTMRPDIKLVPGTNTIEVTAINQRGRRYYKNWTLRTREQSRNEYFGYDFAMAPDDAAQAPPDVLITEPDVPVVLERADSSRRVRVRGVVNSVYPLAGVTIKGQPWAGAADSDKVAFTQDIVVTGKEQQFVIEAADRKGNRTRVTVPVMRPAGRSTAKFSGERYALVVGISRYQAAKGGPPPLYSAAADAEGFAAMLTSRAGFRADHVLVLKDEKAGVAQIRNAFRNFAAEAKPDDLLVVYFAGYGLHDPASPDRIYLASYETQMGQIPESSIEMSELDMLIGTNVRSRNSVLLFDVGRDPGSDWRVAGNNLVNSYLLRLSSKEQGRAVLVSAGVNETSHERQNGGRSEGMFTSWMVDALEGKADWNRDGLVTVGEMFRFVTDQVRQETGGAQVPRYEVADGTLALASAQ